MTLQRPIPLIEVVLPRPLTKIWDQDKVTLSEFTQAPWTAAQFYQMSEIITRVFHFSTYGTDDAPNYPERIGLDRKVHDELFPIAHFARLFFNESQNVTIQWRNGNQNFDATVDDRRPLASLNNIHFLEVTTLQDREDVDKLKELAANGIIKSTGDHREADHLRKVDSLRKALESKGKKKYPPGTALLVYTDEHRVKEFVFGAAIRHIDKKKSFSAVFDEMKSELEQFTDVFVYSKDEIYCSLRS